MSDHKISFADTSFDPVMVPEGQTLSEEMDAANSPLLFGCRTGICGTCIIEVETEGLEPPDEDEQEIIELHAPDTPKARLACQINVTCNIHCKPIEEP